ncbi:MAG TPA: hypothetical protein VK543_18975 [Puia sp.]|nr:hypothetical protein [Puia sp.]
MGKRFNPPLFNQWATWLDFFDYVVRSGLLTEETITIPGTEFAIPMAEIKARAFDEIYNRLPTNQEIDFLMDKLEYVKPSSIREVLAGIPARTNS